jgi:hypothetical protein
MRWITAHSDWLTRRTDAPNIIMYTKSAVLFWKWCCSSCTEYLALQKHKGIPFQSHSIDVTWRTLGAETKRAVEINEKLAKEKRKRF